MKRINDNNKYYVYVYIDPRDYTEFYYGKGCGNRKNSHLYDNDDSQKTKIIKEIKSENLSPIIKVIAKDLTEEQAFLVEKTLIWRLGHTLTNKSSGSFAEKFRPRKTLHKNIWGFDYENGIYFFNCGDSGKNTRSFEDMMLNSFLSAGGHPKYSDPIRSFIPGDIACVYLSKFGYVGVAKILDYAKVSDDFLINGTHISAIKTNGQYHKPNIPKEKREYLVPIKWLSVRERDKAFFIKRSKLYTPQLVKASLENQSITIQMLEKEFDFKTEMLLTNDIQKNTKTIHEKPE